MENKQYLTKERLEQLKEELHELKTKKRLEVAERLKRAKELGDLSENSEYFEAREEQGHVEGSIFELEEMLRNAEVFERRHGNGNVSIGATVVVEREGKQTKYVIVGSNEAKPESGMISNESPLGSAFLNKKPGDVVTVTTPKGKVEYKVISIE
ncbi:MAG TPA: transcription elongation factor GreA [Candidatus Paceibacterota bacterium]